VNIFQSDPPITYADSVIAFSALLAFHFFAIKARSFQSVRSFQLVDHLEDLSLNVFVGAF
jgi:hypothetical protein